MNELTPRHLAQILRARQRLALATLATIIVLVGVVSLLWPKTYEGIVSLVVDSKGTDPITGTANQPELLANNVATEVQVITSHTVALKVVDKLKLDENPDAIRRFRDSDSSAGSIRDWLADRLLKYVDVTPVRDSRVISLQFSGKDPRFAADIANAFADAYIQTSLELTVDPARRQANWFQEQVQGLRKVLEEAQGRLSDFQRKNGIAGADDHLDVESANLAGISTQLVNAQAAASDAQSRLKQMTQATEKQQLDQLPDVLGSTTLQSMKVDLERAEGQLADISQRYDRNHPQYMSAAAEVAALKSKLTAELAAATGAIRQNAEIAQQRSAELQRSVDEQKAHILRLKQLRDEQDVLLRDVQDAQTTYDGAIQRASAVKLEGQLNQSSIAILSPAVVPLTATRPRVILNFLLAFIFGSAIAVAAAVVAESIDGRVRSVTNLIESNNLIVLAEMPFLLTTGPKAA